VLVLVLLIKEEYDCFWSDGSEIDASVRKTVAPSRFGLK